VLSDVVSTLTSDFGVAPVIYTDAFTWDTELGDPSGYGADPLWFVKLGSTAPASGDLPASNWFGDSWTLWQYSFTGSVPGVTGDVDLDQANTTPPVLACPAGTSSCSSASTYNGSAVASNGGTTATASGGTGTVTVSQYSSDPETALPNSTDEYFDVSVSDSAAPFTSVDVVDCTLNGGDTLWWWNGSSWVQVSPQSPSPTGCVTADLSASSTPTVSELTGTVFAVTTTPSPSTSQLTITKSDSVGGSSITGAIGTATPGDSISYSIGVANVGTVSATNLLVSDDLPSQGLIDISSPDLPAEVTFNSSDDSWNMGTLAAGSSVIVTLGGTVPSDATGSTYVNEASVSASNASTVEASDSDTLTSPTSVNVNVTVSGTMTYGGAANLAYGTSPSVTLTGSISCATVNGGHGVSTLDVGKFTVDGSSCSGLVAPDGDTITYSGASNGFVVGAAPLTVTASSGSFTYGTAPPVITPGYVGFENGDGPGSLGRAPTCSTTAKSSSPVGSYPSTCVGALDTNYAFKYVAGTVKVTPAPSRLSLTALPPGPVPLGSMVRYLAVVSKGPVAGTLSGVVAFTDDGTPIVGCTAVRLFLAVATCQSAARPLGDNTIGATYENDPDFAGSSASLAHVVFEAPLITSTNHASATVGQPFSFQVAAVGFPTPTIAEMGALPKGVTFTSGGLLAGTPALGTGGLYVLTFTASNAYGATHQSFVLVLDEVPAITSSNYVTATLGRHFAFQVVATGYPALTFSEKGPLPKGVTFTPGGLLSGSPQSVGTYVITVTATNAAGTIQQGLTLTT
jgi:uncharacterized repeat protein (TIGR01451 family)